MPSPMMKATLAAAGLSSASNILAQFLEAYRDSSPFVFDFAKFLQFVTVTFITAPPNYMWQQLLERNFPAYERKEPVGDVEKQTARDEDGGVRGDLEQKPKLNWRNTFTKWFIDCITLGAIMNTVAFFILMGILKRESMDQIRYNVRTETIPVIVAGYKIWPFASIISFSCVPVERRIVFLNFVGLLWGIYMSLVASRV
ncbi:uncharacterized protein F4807DRAFT_198970 [Annulohypoxylon truncatum]|uniref:uncharacterized protein n=1 Tax=Annulohypoxylon truncatum TaxID=327061 RepID=UPI002008771C|nr:uncharacterized protein F4807DRAFT_198970 [Annulohypoxylon truncatum]KAI1213761.1 hypothetical protein F4807DRAFT_198970 [Annulohypoxylon truncatum]